MSKPLAIVAGAGAGLGQSLALAFEQNGYAAFGLNRSVPDKTAAPVLACDLTDAAQTERVVRGLINAHGAPDAGGAQHR